MFGTLLESRPSRPRRRASAALSAMIHLTVVSAAVGATLPRRTIPPGPSRVLDGPLVWTNPVDRPASPHSGTTARCVACLDLRPFPPLPPVPVTPVIDESWVPKPNWDSLFIAERRAGSASAGPLVDNPLASHGLGTRGGDDVYAPPQVDRAVTVLGAIRPVYPEMLRAAGIEGRVVVRFVVDTTGRVEPASITLIESTHALFEHSVRDVLPRLHFAPAEAGGRHVRQLVEMPFQFSLSNR